MPITITSDRIQLKNSSGTIKFDTNEDLYHATNFVSGSFSLSAVTASATSFGRTNIDQTNTHTLATGINSSATHVLGLYKGSWTVTSSFAGTLALANASWKNANATGVDMIFRHLCHHSTANPGQTSASPQTFQGFSLYTFYISGTSLLCKERIVLQSYTASTGSTAYTITRGAGTIDYRIYCGLFT
tara:strand:+ start:12804 stop:13364 length:561 start_codon:yes stop_codon:yes gene_type:complete